MAKIILGKTGLKIEKNGFGALPIQRASFDETKEIVQKAYANGINFYDTARAYTDSEEKLNYAFEGFNDKYPRESIIIATKTQGENRKDIEKARERLVFEEFLFFILKVRELKSEKRAENTLKVDRSDSVDKLRQPFLPKAMPLRICP